MKHRVNLPRGKKAAKRPAKATIATRSIKSELEALKAREAELKRQLAREEAARKPIRTKIGRALKNILIGFLTIWSGR